MTKPEEVVVVVMVAEVEEEEERQAAHRVLSVTFFQGSAQVLICLLLTEHALCELRPAR